MTHKHTTIFGRAYIINTKILPKLLYQLNIFVPPRSFYKKLNKIIRPFIFKGTVSKIRETILNMRPEKGGIGLQNIAAKVTTMRVKTINQMIENKDRFPLLEYFLGLALTPGRSPPPFFALGLKINPPIPLCVPRGG